MPSKPNDLRDMDYFLRDLISNLKSHIDFQIMGGLDKLSEPERVEFLKKMQKSIGLLYESLDKNIMEKHRRMQGLMDEVLATQKELERERNKLQKRNDVVEQDLLLAKNIQRQIIPEQSDNPNIGLFYKPMDQLGGDFFDVIDFREIEKIGFFISDVSGHGIPASLITTIMKSVLVQKRSSIGIPSEVLSHMNQILYDLIPGNFVTGFLGELDLKRGTLQYANAGHNYPIVISERGVQYVMSDKSGIPLAVMSNEDLLNHNRSYRNDTYRLEKGSKLLIYTDGLTETVPFQSGRSLDVPDFETTRLGTCLMENRHLPAQQFVPAVYRNLVDFRGSEEFDDDICMICYDFS